MLEATGRGNPGYKFKDEINAKALGLADIQVARQHAAEPHVRTAGPALPADHLPRRREEGGQTMETRPTDEEIVAMVEDGLVGKSVLEVCSAIGYGYDETLTVKKPIKGRLCMANSGPSTNGSQFFINLGDTPHLTGLHTVFGEVSAGYDIVEKIGNVQVGMGDKPAQPVVIESLRLKIKGSIAVGYCFERETVRRAFQGGA